MLSFLDYQLLTNIDKVHMVLVLEKLKSLVIPVYIPFKQLLNDVSTCTGYTALARLLHTCVSPILSPIAPLAVGAAKLR